MSSPVNYSFYLELQPVRELRLAIEALADPNLHKGGLGFLSVDDQGFRIMVKNPNKDMAFLRLGPCGTNIISFRSFGAMTGSVVPLGFISHSFPAHLNDDYDCVFIYHVRRTTQLCFKFRTNPPSEFKAEFVVTPPLIGRKPFATVFCGTAIPTKDLRQMIDYMLQAGGPIIRTVLVHMIENFARFEMASRRQWAYHYDQNEIDGTTGLEQGQIQRAVLEWTYATFLYKASFLQSECTVCFLSVPAQHIMFRFRMQGLGDLIITQASLSMDPEVYQPTVDSEDSDEEENPNTFSF